MSKLLAVDCGNSDTVFALVEAGASDAHHIESLWRVATASVQSSGEMDTKLDAGFAKVGYSPASVQGVILANVVPDLQEALEDFVRARFSVTPLRVHQARKQVGIAVRIDAPDSLGEDRLANTVGAHARYKVPLVVVDFGSAVTFDCVDGTGAYVGGVIAPGINLSRKALHEGTAKLPQVDFVRPQGVVGQSTLAALQSGFYWGYVGLVEGILSRLKNDFPYEQVIATGGQAELVAESLPMVDEVNVDLTLYGLAELFVRATANK